MALTLSDPCLPAKTMSPLVLSDRLLTLAQEADRAGLQEAASELVVLAHTVLDAPASVAMPCFMLQAGNAAALLRA